jgi:hypothetical protein
VKKCSKCGERKPFDDFNKYSRSKDGRQPYCRLCARDYFVSRREQIVPRIHERSKRVRQELTRYVYAYLAEHSCVDCGESDPIVLEFDHVRGTKVANVSKLVKQAAPLARVLAEIEKCDVRCANCHRRRTVKTLGWNSFL